MLQTHPVCAPLRGDGTSGVPRRSKKLVIPRDLTRHNTGLWTETVPSAAPTKGIMMGRMSEDPKGPAGALVEPHREDPAQRFLNLPTIDGQRPVISPVSK